MRHQVGRWRWGGALPQGYDANSIAAESIAGIFNGKCRLGSGYTKKDLRRELARLVRGEISRLHKRAERWAVRSEWDFLPLDEENQPQSILDGIEGPELNGAEVMMEKEAAAEREAYYDKIEEGLGEDKEARAVFRCMREGMRTRAEIAALLRMSVAAVTNARKRIVRKVREI